MTVPQRLSFSAQLSNCNLATCWHIEVSTLGLHLSISIHFRKSFSCCMRFFQKNDPWAGLGRILRNHRKTLMSSVYLCLISWEIRLVLNTNVTDWKLMSFCHGNEHHGIDPNILSSGHHDCSTKAVFLSTAVKLQSCPLLAHWTQHTGPSNTLQSAFIWAISSSGSMKFFQLKITLGLALGESWLLLAEPQKNTDVYKGLLPWEGFPKQTCINHIPRKQGCKLVDQI